MARLTRFQTCFGIGMLAVLFAVAGHHAGEATVTQQPLHSDQRQASEKRSTLRIVPGLEEPLVATGPTTAAEDRALDAAIGAFKSASRPGDLSLLDTFISEHPASPWRLALLTDRGLAYYHEGYFSQAMTAWEAAWEAGRNVTEPKAKALADRAVGELARMHARLGHTPELEKLFAEIGNRPISGPATEMITGAREGLWMFHNEPGGSYLCGPMALKNLLIALKADKAKVDLMDQQRSGPHGFSLDQVAKLADQIGLHYRLVYRTPGQPVPVPSIVNWKLHHYAAIVGEQAGRYHVNDPTFASGDAWLTQGAIDEEGSGYFLVPTQEDKSDTAWRTASVDEARQVYGMGYTSQNQPGATTTGDNSLKSDCGAKGMCVANAKTMVVSLNLNDSPVGYEPPVGPSARIRLTYNQREASQPAVFSFFNVSPKWTLNVLSWVQDSPTSPGNSVLRYAAGGGSVDYSSGYSYNSSTGAFSPERQDQDVLVRIPATGPATSYELRDTNGSKQVFARADGATTYPRRFFMSQIVDSAGNALSLHYDSGLRLTSITDATGRDTTFTYGLTTNPLLVTRITDPFGRHADLTYDANGHLSSITDVLGLTSSFSYDAGGLVNAMTTPYGTSHFVYGDGSNDTRYLEMTDPLGLTERLEFRHLAPGIPYSDPVVPSGLGINNNYLYYRNSFYWDKNIYPVTHTDYTKAQLTHWLHNPVGQTSPIVESTMEPLERRVWRTYPGQSPTYYEGTTGTPTAIARVLDDGTTQASKFTYNPSGKPLTIIDPRGRMTRLTYAANNIDLVTVEQKTTVSGYSTVATFTYNSQHRPLTYSDAAGKAWSFTYNSAGQLTSRTNPLGETTSYEYDSLGYPTRALDANGKTAATYTYDSNGRVATHTDSEGYTVSYNYDAFDRVTQASFPDGTTYQYSWDKLDLASVTDRLGRVTHYAYNADQRRTSVTDPLGHVMSYGYYPNGTLKTLTDANGNTTTWLRDLQSRVTAKVYTDGQFMTYAYESTTSRRKSVTDALGQTKSYTYAIDNRPASLAYANAQNLTSGVNFTWDAYFPRLVSMADGNGTTSFQYEPISSPGALEIASEDGPYNNDTIAYQYDALDRVVGQTVDSATDSLTYDALGRVAGRSNPLGTFTNGYLGETGQPISLAMAGGPIQTQLAYEDNAGDRRLKSITQYGLARSFGLTNRPENLIDQITETGGTSPKIWGYGYDAADRLTSAQASTGALYKYDYDATDNITTIQSPSGTKSVDYNNLNQIDQAGGQTYHYNVDGNLIEDDQHTYQWDAENRLVAIGYKAAPGRETDFRYDGLSRRLAIVEKSSTSTVETRYLWCGDSLCQARTSSDVVIRRYYPDGEVWPQTGTRLFYTTDHLGSVRDVMAAPSGARIAYYDYDAYGNPTVTAGRVSVDFRYAGMFYHQGSGLYLTNYRAYDPRAGRWLSRDPIEETGGINLYGYVMGNPVTYSDTSGLWAGWDDALALGSGALVGVIGQGFSDVLKWHHSGWEVYSGAAIGGAAGGETLLLTANPFLAGEVGGAAQNASTQLFELKSGHRKCFNYATFGGDILIGGATGGFVPGLGKLLGKGGGNWGAVTKQIVTKFSSGKIATITSTTAGKILANQLAEGLPGAAASALGGKIYPLSPDPCACND